MPVTETTKSSDGAKKKTTENSSDMLPRKRSARVRESSVDVQSRGDDLSPHRVASRKKSATRKVTSENNTEKKVKNPVGDKVAKKTVQRAKASIALNKTIELAEEKKKNLSDVEENTRSSLTAIKDNTENTKLEAVRSKVKQTTKSSRPGSERTIPSGKKKNWATVVKKSEPEVKEEEPPPPVPVPVDTKPGEIQTEGLPLSSCSFFEKLQQGVKAYFASRNSLTDDKSRKKVTEGGIDSG